ncbi:hypothetical protein [Alkalicoccus luteus]|uniref:Uncharacterized protein n=1 Tax=Alkalicoccus luteus TaxID=1237094 RepID=A0A969PNP5_9BACI|nr:hypothetical protein [Alkalicoccus luteus]NJP37556.1 hypothetical protein [Alkalicoccus luteus]
MTDIMMIIAAAAGGLLLLYKTIELAVKSGIERSNVGRYIHHVKGFDPIERKGTDFSEEENNHKGD